MLQGGFHELMHEPDGVKEKYVDVCVEWILKRAGKAGEAKL